ncbi:MAG: c-type cytochrome, partial [Planctomycetaceae bacterium]|nr:c-type cytochrome [Planctomycetaceae bacterium]
MPATEQTWRNLKTMHVVFGLASLGMLITTILMLAGDNVREWKAYQRQFRDIETWTAESRVTEEQTASFDAKKAELEAALKAVQAAPVKAELVDQVLAIASAKAKEYSYDLAGLKAARDAAVSTSTASGGPKNRDNLVAAMDAALGRAKFIEAKEQRDLKGTRAKFDEVNSNLSIAIDEAQPESVVASHQIKVDEVKKQVAANVLRYEDARTHRTELQAAIAAVTADEAAAKKALADHEGTVKRLQTAVYERGSNAGKRFLEMPVIDAFGRPLKVEQIWLPTLTLNNNFRDVARFDRCTTCHQGIDKTAAGSAVAAGYEGTARQQLTLATPKDPKDPSGSGKPLDGTPSLGSVYGISLADKGVVNAGDVTVEVVWPKTAAAMAGLKPGDVIEMVGDTKVRIKNDVESRLLKSTKWGEPITLSIRRGVPQPFSSHPRLDLFVGSLSPHKMGDFGCTICHEGQGSATQFKWVSHTPKDPRQAHEWAREHGWFNNHHWILPMLPARFAESSCLKCHHDVVELHPSERFPEPPAAKLVQGWETIKDIGCFGCHEINGYDGPSKRRGPDLRVEPNYASLAQQLLTDTSLSAEQRRLAQDIASHPDRNTERKLLAESLLTSPAAKDGKLNPVSKKMAEMLAADDETPGKLRKVGPSLRYLSSKVDEAFVYDWVREPKHFRPNTKMPQFFGLHDHLGENDEAVKYEPVEILAVTKYLLSASQKFDYTSAATGVEAPSVERGKVAFLTRGCVACHQHPDVKDGKATHGPDLARLGAKLGGEKGAKWLYTWLRDPTNYHARTSMPNLFLDPQKGADGKLVDPAADIVAYLLAQKGWQPQPIPSLNTAALDELVEKYLKGAFTTVDAKKFAKDGIPADRGARVAGDEALLVAGRGDLQNQKLLYLGKKSISRLGCAACHDIPGQEDAKSIGAGLADWGRKEPSKLAFEQVVSYVQGKLAAHGDAHDAHGPAKTDAAHGDSGGGHGHPDLVHMDPDQGFFLEALFGHHREGFIWQKLREPRSYDYKKVENKDYLDRLRMPKFNLTDAQREAIMTFVLGLVAEPPAAKYVYKGTPRNV